MSRLERIIFHIKNLSATRILIVGYCLVILIGTLLLCLPVSLRNPVEVSLFTAFFTSVSASCVTGLVLVDTWTHWSFFGQCILLILIQVGGIGFMTICIAAVSVSHRKIGMSSRIVMQNAISAPKIRGIVRMTRFVAAGTLAAEAIGAGFLSFHFVPLLGPVQGIWYAVFHSISAFCNAGFDLMGQISPFSSFTVLSSSLLVNLTIMVLIISGGLGFLVWSDLFRCRFRFRYLSLHSKIAVSITILLVLGGGLLLYILESSGPAMAAMSPGEKWLAAFFQSVTARTAGFNTLDVASMTEAGLFLIILLMIVGGSPGSTAGGIKTTTFAVLFLSITTTSRNRCSTTAFGRQLEEGVTRTAAAVLMSYLLLTLSASIIISHFESLPLLICLFETVSAIATVGITCGITPEISPVSAAILAVLMIFGRVGSLTLLRSILSGREFTGTQVPHEKIQIG